MPGEKEGDFGLVELSEMMYRANAGKPVEAKLLVGFCIMMPRRVLDEVGLIDEALFLGNDDLDISWRLRMAGYKLLIATDTFVYHEGQVSFKSEEESKTSALVQDSTDRLYEKLEAHFGEGNVPHPMELWGIDWFKPSRAIFAPKPREKEQGLTSIIVLTYNELNHTKLCLASIEAHTPEPHELIIVDNGSTDGTVEFLREYIEARPNVRVLANSSNRGFAAGNNQGMALARGDYVLLLNNDTIVTPGWLERMLAVFGRYENVGIVGPMSNYVSGPQLVEEASYGNEAEMAAFAAQWAEENSGQIEPIMRVVGFCLLARREVIDRIGGLDERFGSGNFEDDDLCIRAARVGYEASVARDVFIHHAGSQTFKGAKIDYRQAMERNWGLFKAKWGIPVETPLEGIYHLPPELPEGAGQYIALPDLESGHRPEQGGLWWREAPEEELEPMVRLGFLRDGPDLAEAMESIQRFNGTLGPHSVWADSASINEQLGRSEYLVLMTPDVIVTKPWLETMLAVADSDESIAAVGPTSNAAPGPQRVKGGYKSLKKELQKFASKRSRQHNKAWEEVPYLGGFCLLLRSQAVRDVGGLDEDVPTSEWLWDLYGRLQAEGFRLACALGAYVHHSELTEDEGSRYDEQALVEESAPEVLGEAQIALEQGDLESAAGLFEEAVRQAPSLASAHWAYGSTLVALDRVNEGIEALRQAAELAPCEAALHNQLGVTLYQVGEPEEAMEAFETALTAAPDDLDVLLNLVELHRDQGRYTEAASHLEQAQRLAPVDAGVLSALGAISLDLGDVETAQKALQHLEALEPEHPEIQPLRQALEA
jgi:GT2 family glycosyltransferase/Flp pilus assembly protein TadD